MFRWNGRQWVQLSAPYGPETVLAPVQLVAAAAPAAPAVVAFQAPVPAARVEPQPEWLPAAPQAPPPPAFVPEPEPAPAWAPPPPQQSKLLVYLAAGLVVVLLGAGGWVVRGQMLARLAHSVRV